MATMTNNGSPTRSRKQLSDQLDRLDSILDGLSEALNESITLAVKEAIGVAVQEVVRGVLTELLTNPEITARLQPSLLAPPAVPPLGPTWRDRLNSVRTVVAARWQDVRQGCRTGARTVQQGAATCWNGTRQAAGKVWSRCLLLAKIRNQVVTALCVGTAAALFTWLAGPWLATALSGVAGFTTTLVAQFGLWLRRLFNGTPCPAG